MTLTQSRVTRSAEARRSWPTLLGSTLGIAVGVGSLPLYSNSAIFVDVERRFGWSASALALVFLIANLAMAAVGPFWGRVLDRAGTRRPVLIGGAALGLSYLILALVPDNFALSIATQVFAYMGAVATASLGYTRTIASSFVRMRGLAFGIMNTGPALIALALPALTTALIGWAGIRGAYLALGLIVLVGTGVAVLLMPRLRPEQRLAEAAAAQATPLRVSTPLVVLAVAFFLAAIATIGLIEEMFTLLLKAGTPMGTVVGLLSSIGLAMLVIRLVVGALLDAVPPKWLAVTLFVISAATVGLLAVAGPPVALAATLGLGLALGSETDVMPVLVGRIFPHAQFGRVMGVVGMAFGVGVALGPLLLAVVLDSTPGATATCLVAAAMLLAAAAGFAMLPRTPRGELPDATQPAVPVGERGAATTAHAAAD